MDAFILGPLVQELNRELVAATVVGIHAWDQWSLAFRCRRNGRQQILLVSSDPTLPRLYLTCNLRLSTPLAETRAELAQAWHRVLKGARIKGFQQIPNERIVQAVLLLPDQEREVLLITELLGAHSNLLLVESKNQTIELVLRPTDPGTSAKRLLARGLTYTLPPPYGVAPEEVTKAVLARWLEGQPLKAFARLFARRTQGWGPLLAREIVAWAELREEVVELDQATVEALWGAYQKLLKHIKGASIDPTLIRDQEGTALVVSPWPLRQFAGFPSESFPSINRALALFFEEHQAGQEVTHRRGILTRKIKRQLIRNTATLEAVQRDLTNAEQAEQLRRYGELILAHLPDLEKGKAAASVVDYYLPDRPWVKIPLDPSKSPSDNAQVYFKRYKKAKKGLTVIQHRVQQLTSRQNHLQTLEKRLQQAKNLDELEGIEQALQKLGLTGAKSIPRSRSKKPSARPNRQPGRRFRSTDGWLILVGRNRQDSDALTFHYARPHDLWFHARGVEGSHVLIWRPNRNQMPSRQTCLEAAALAAFFCKARGSSTVAVDFTEKRYVRRPKGGKTGMAHFTHAKTLFVAPQVLVREEHEHDNQDDRSQSI